MKKTKEEIIYSIASMDERISGYKKETVIKAMEEYAKQESQPSEQIRLSERLGGGEYRDLSSVIAEQMNIPNDDTYKFICRDCKNWITDTCGCKKNYFIATVGAHIPKCFDYEPSA